MNEFSRPSRFQAGGNSTWILVGLVLGIIAGLVLRLLAPSILAQTAMVRQIFGGLLLIVSVPLLTSQFALALNNPRDRVRRGVSHSRILVQVLVVTVVLLILAAVAAVLFSPSDSADPFVAFLQVLNPITLVTFHSGGAGLLLFGVAMLAAAVLGVMGDRAQHLITISNRVSRAAIRTFRLLLWVAPLGLASIVGTFGTQPESPITAFTFGLPILTIVTIAGLFAYTTIVLGVDWIIGQLRPKRPEHRSFDRDRRSGQRPVGGRYQSAGRSTGVPARPTGRTGSETRRDRERSPFEMGVSSTPVLDITAPRASQSSPTPATKSEPGPRPDAKPRPARDGQFDSDRQAPTEKSREQQPDSRRFTPRDRGGRPDRREGGRPDRQFDRGPREGRPERPQRDRGSRPSRFDRRDSQRPAEPVIDSHVDTQPPMPVNAATIAEDLARVRQQLDRAEGQESPKLPITQPPIVERPSEQPTGTGVQEAPAASEMHYGRARHRKAERPESDPHPGVEPPPMPEMVDHYSTDDMAFGRGKRKKTVK